MNVEFQEAEPLWVMYLGCVVNRGRIEQLKGDTFSCGKGIFSEWKIWVAKGNWWPGCMGEGRLRKL